MSIFETKDQKQLAAQRAEMMQATVQQQLMQQQLMQMEQQKIAAALYNSPMQAPPSPSKINEALDFKDWVRDTLPDVWDQYRAVKDIERCSK